MEKEKIRLVFVNSSIFFLSFLVILSLDDMSAFLFHTRSLDNVLSRMFMFFSAVGLIISLLVLLINKERSTT